MGGRRGGRSGVVKKDLDGRRRGMGGGRVVKKDVDRRKGVDGEGGWGKGEGGK